LIGDIVIQNILSFALIAKQYLGNGIFSSISSKKTKQIELSCVIFFENNVKPYFEGHCEGSNHFEKDLFGIF